MVEELATFVMDNLELRLSAINALRVGANAFGPGVKCAVAGTRPSGDRVGLGRPAT